MIKTSKSSLSLTKSLALASLALAGVVLVAGPARAGDVDAAKLWKKNCETCHGADGKGKTKAGEKAGVKDLTSAEVKGKINKAKAIEDITKGIKEKDGDKLAMKAYGEKLSKEEIEALADYTLGLK